MPLSRLRRRGGVLVTTLPAAVSGAATRKKKRLEIAKADVVSNLFRMASDLRPIIEEIADRADDFLAGAKDRAQGRAGIEEVLTMDYPGLDPVDRRHVVAGVMSTLEDEDFFGTEFVGDPFSDDDEEPEPI